RIIRLGIFPSRRKTLSKLYGKISETEESENGLREASATASARYAGRTEEESFIIDFARKGITDVGYPFSLYKWEAEALMDGLNLRDVDTRRAQLDQAIYIAGLSNADKPKRALSKMNSGLDKIERKITNKKNTPQDNKRIASMIGKVGKLFSGENKEKEGG
ncbi:hypothetical protein ACR91Y_27110, partial [Klebsiella pneumoniae]